MSFFDIPVTLFFFKREEKTVKIINRIAEVKPQKLYLIADGPRNDIELERVKECRKRVEAAITWDCEVIKNYADENKGVYNRIGLGAKWVFEREKSAIFLEDDNLPDPTFFPFCKELLAMYENDTRVFWICGTNYLEKFNPCDDSSYVFTKHMLPCGWASWSHKFPKYYDGEMQLWKNGYIRKRVVQEIEYRPLAKQLMQTWNRVDYQFKTYGKPGSWDGQMSFTQRSQNLYAIVPKNNLIENIGADADSEHGGTSMKNKMTKRFCSIKTYPIEFPLIHPKGFMTDPVFEKRTNRIITLPIDYRIKGYLIALLKIILGKDVNKPFRNK
jgi:hypothetical protein